MRPGETHHSQSGWEASVEVEARGNDILEGFESQVRNSLGNLAERRAVLLPASQFLVFKGREVRQ